MKSASAYDWDPHSPKEDATLPEMAQAFKSLLPQLLLFFDNHFNIIRYQLNMPGTIMSDACVDCQAVQSTLEIRKRRLCR